MAFSVNAIVARLQGKPDFSQGLARCAKEQRFAAIRAAIHQVNP
jgi:hypothetical protein